MRTAIKRPFRNHKKVVQRMQNIGNQLGSDKDSIADLSNQGMLSGRDDYSDDSGDRVEEESTGEPTNR